MKFAVVRRVVFYRSINIIQRDSVHNADSFIPNHVENMIGENPIWIAAIRGKQADRAQDGAPTQGPSRAI